MKYLSLVALLVLTACGGSGGGKSLPPTFNGDGANAVGCTTEVVAGVLPGINIDCGGGPVFVPYGIDGAKGDQGEAGVAGTDGVNGTNGADGNDGVDGQDGASCTFEDQPAENRVAIDCGGNIIYIPKSGNGSGDSNSPTIETERILLNPQDYNVSTIYSNNAEWVVRLFEDGVLQHETFRKRFTQYNPGLIKQRNYYNELEELHQETDIPARIKYYVSSSQHYKESEEYFIDGILNRINDQPAKLIYSNDAVRQKWWYIDGINTRLNPNSNPSMIYYNTSTGFKTNEEYRNADGELHRDGGLASSINFSSTDGTTVLSSYWHKNDRYHRENGPAHVSENSNNWYCGGLLYKQKYWSSYNNQYVTTYANNGKSGYLAACGTEAGWNAGTL